jgi:hypothetical protein
LRRAGHVASWANPGEGERFKQLSKDYTSQHGVQVTWQQVVGDYQSKLLTRLPGGSAPDAFYASDSSMAPMIASDKLEKLDDFLGRAESPVKIGDVAVAAEPAAVADQRRLRGSGSLPRAEAAIHLSYLRPGQRRIRCRSRENRHASGRPSAPPRVHPR